MLSHNQIIDNTYRILTEIGQGGMGVVYLAYHLRLQKNVVLKKIKNKNLDINIIRNEVDILKTLHHQYLPQVYDIINIDGEIYTVIDYINGYDLNYYIKNKYVFNESQLIKWLKQLCEVLSYLHTQSVPILHTDIKPSNILITEKGDICLIDFGISLHGDLLKGFSRSYSSPEQYEMVLEIENSGTTSLEIDARTDIYSLGATFYKIMSDYTPDLLSLEQYPLSEINFGYSDALVSIIEKAMAYDKNKRYQSALDMWKALDGIYKLDTDYRKYILLQIIVSIVATICLVSGLFFLVTGCNGKAVDSVENKYNEFVYCFSIDDYHSAEKIGLELINSIYFDNLNSDKKSEIYHSLGEVYYEDNQYKNSSEFYKKAIDLDKNDNPVYCRDYIFSLIKSGNKEEAYNKLEEYRKTYPSSAELLLLDAQLSYENGDYQTAVSQIDKAINTLSDKDSKYLAYIIKGDSCVSLKYYYSAIDSYYEAMGISETKLILRKLGNILLYAGNDMGTFHKALDVFEVIIDKKSFETEDVINYAQACYLSNAKDKWNKCISLLEEQIKNNSNECRLYMMLSIMYYKQNNFLKAKENIERVHTLFSTMNSEQIGSLDGRFLNQIKTMYKELTGNEW